MFKNHFNRSVVAAALLGVGALMLNSQTASAGQGDTNSSSAATGADDTVGFYHPFSVSPEISSAGVGGTFGWRFMDHLGAHAGADYWYQSGDADIKSLRYGYKLKVLSETVALDIYPWKTHSFRVALGMMINQSDLSGHISGGYTLDGIRYSGTLDLSIKPKPVEPYLGIGGNLFYFDHAHHWAMFGELGAAYTGEPRVTFTASDSRASGSLVRELDRVQNALNKFPIWPILKLGVTYSF